METVISGMGEYEHILSHTERMQILGHPRSWSLVSRGFHPFAPERIAVLPSGANPRHVMSSVLGDWRRIEARIAELRMTFPPPHGPADLPDEKLGSSLLMMDLITSHYHIPEVFEDWLIGLVWRESLASTSVGEHWGLVHQYQGRHNGRLDCPPVDWWLFLFPDGIDWASLDERPVHALIGHVGRGPYCEEPGLMLRAYCLTSEIMKNVDDARMLSRMGRVAAARHLNRIAAECLKTWT
jgi:hypothetical protein